MRPRPWQKGSAGLKSLSVTAPSPLIAPRAALVALGALAAWGILLIAPDPAHAQAGRTTLGVRVGLVSPRTDLADWHRVDSSVSVGVDLERRLTDRLGVRVDGAFARLGGKLRFVGSFEEPGPAVNLWHVIAGLTFELTPPESRWEVGAGAGGGLTFFDVDESAVEVVPNTSEAALTDTKPTGNFGVWAGYQLTRRLFLFTRTEGFAMLGDASDPDDYLGSEWTMVNALGVRVTF